MDCFFIKIFIHTFLHKYVEKCLVVQEGNYTKKGPREELYKEACVLECLLRFTEIPEFISIFSLTAASFSVNFQKRIVLDSKLSCTVKFI